MIDDTKHLENGIKASRINLSSEIDQILKHQVVRAHAERWSHDLRFLTFDDSGLSSDEVASNESREDEDDVEEILPNRGPVTGQCQRCELRTPIPSGHQCESHFRLKSRTNERELALREYANPCVHVSELSCAYCQHIPLFPNQGAVTTFKIRRIDPTAWTRCRHFVAVSYCWAAQDSETDGVERTPYTVVEEDNSVRDMRASRSTIDRVVDFARQNGFRMIWIDQECIEQDKAFEKELAVQAMDLVYLEAHTSIGLLQSYLQQKHLDALLLIYEANHAHLLRKRRGRSAFQGCRSLVLSHLAEAVSLIANDKWNTRAWVLQEAFVSSGNMTLLFPRTNDINITGWALACHEMSLSEIAIRLDIVVQCIRSCFDHVSAVIGRQISNADAPSTARTKSSTTDTSPSSSELKKTLERIVLFHPPQPQTSTSMTVMLNQSRVKRTCNAATALTYLRLRDLYSVADKLAIVANMCGYALRLNSARLGETQDSLGLCMITLSLANGDFSLITPELYRFPTGENGVSDALTIEDHIDPGFSWNQNFCSRLPHIYSTTWNPHGNTAFLGAGSSPDLSSSGISLIGMIWKMDRYIDMRRLKRKYDDSWASLNRNLAKTPASTFRLGTTHLLFEIIRDLISRDEISTADAILNSTSNPAWQVDSKDRGIESVKNLPPGLNVESRSGMFSLDHSDDGRFHQCWIIDRIMAKGGFWVGKVVNAMRLPSQTPRSEMAQIDVPAEGNSKFRPNPSLKGHQSQLFTLWLMSNMTSLAGNMGDETGDPKKMDPATFAVLQGDNMAWFAHVLANGRSGGRSSDEMEERRSVFDVDGDVSGKCLIFQPFHMVLESIPRPELRSMSVSWRVEPVESGVDEETENGTGEEVESGVDEKVKDLPDEKTEERTNESSKGYKQRTFTTHGKVKGMWQYNLSPGTRVLLV